MQIITSNRTVVQYRLGVEIPIANILGHFETPSVEEQQVIESTVKLLEGVLRCEVTVGPGEGEASVILPDGCEALA